MIAAIPRIVGTKPLKLIPVQFSLHVEVAPGAESTHHEHLEPDQMDPRRGLAQALAQAFEGYAFRAGTVTTSSVQVERRAPKRLAGCTEDTSVSAPPREGASRPVDRNMVVRDHLYDPGLVPSISPQPVTRVLIGPEFDHVRLALTDGTTAMTAYAQLRAPATPPDDRSGSATIYAPTPAMTRRHYSRSTRAAAAPALRKGAVAHTIYARPARPAAC